MKVALGTLKEKGDDLVAFLEPRVGTKPALDGDTVEIDDEVVRKGVKPRDVKTYIKRFLYMNSLRKNYRVLVEGRELTVQELELGEEEEEKKKEVSEKVEKAKEEVREGEGLEEAEKKEKKEAKAEEKEKKEKEAEKPKEGKPKEEKKGPKGEKKVKPAPKKKAKTKTKED